MHKAVYIYTDNGEFMGYAALKDGSLKLQSTNIWAEAEAEQFYARLRELNEADRIKDHWPDARDPEVLRFTDDPEWEPLEMTDHQMIDEDSSYLVWIKIQELDENGEETGEETEGPDLDMQASVIRYKTVQAPARQSDVGARIRKAQELVARSRVC